MSPLTEITTFVLTNIWSVLPYFLISIALAVLINKLEFDSYIRYAFHKNIGLAILLATLVGAFSPFCSCTVIPIVSGLLLSGVPLAPVMAFWIASPTMDPEIFALTVGILGWPLATARLLATLVLSLGAGYLTLLLTRSGVLNTIVVQAKEKVAAASTEAAACCTPAAAPEPVSTVTFASEGAIPLTMTQSAAIPAESSCGCSCETTATISNEGNTAANTPLIGKLQSLDWADIGHEMAVESWRIGRWLILAFLLEALIIRYIPQEAIASILGQNPFATVLAALVGIPLYLSNYSALPIVDGLLTQGMQPGAAIAFLIAGPVTTVPAMTAVWGIVHRRVFALYLAIGLLGATALGIMVNLIL